MGQPGDGVGLAAAGGVLDEIIGSGFLHAGVGHELPHAVELVVARKDHRLPFHFFAAELLFLDLEMDEPRQDVEEAVPFEDLFPEIGGFVTSWILRVACSASAAPVEGQKIGAAAGKPRGHVNLVGVQGEVDQRAPLELEDRIRRVAVILVLCDRMPPGLGGHGVFEFQRRYGDAVQGQGDIEGIAMPGRIAKLAGHREPVGRIEFPGVRIHSARRGEVCRAEQFAEAFEPVSQNGEAAFMVGVERPAEVVQQCILGLLLLEGGEVFPFLGLRRLDEGDHIGRKQGARRVERFPVALLVTACGGQVMLDGGLECVFGVWFHGYSHSVIVGAKNLSLLGETFFAPTKSFAPTDGFSRSKDHCAGLLTMYSRTRFNSSLFRMTCS
ncbi:MAG: hypothetical protein A4E68_00025 [Syntrophaceae bacterium PtaB.Bin095]|nr:MAG: hypothetical protein A4E68_00025 [Syntrophaceae bacterium PtaB.Bin095]